MESKNKCDCDLSQCNLDMTVRECLEKLGMDPETAEKKFKECCKDCCPRK